MDVLAIAVPILNPAVSHALLAPRAPHRFALRDGVLPSATLVVLAQIFLSGSPEVVPSVRVLIQALVLIVISIPPIFRTRHLEEAILASLLPVKTRPPSAAVEATVLQSLRAALLVQNLEQSKAAALHSPLPRVARLLVIPIQMFAAFTRAHFLVGRTD